MQSQYEKRVKHSVDKAEAYTRRDRGKHAAEMRLVERALEGLSGAESFLDAPCGVGRVTLMLQQRGHRAVGVDLGAAASEVARRELARRDLPAEIARADLEALPFPDEAFDAVVCFRFFHHLPAPEYRARIVAELCRVAQRYVLISYFSPYSITSIKRALRHRLGGRVSRQHATPLREVRDYFQAQGFHLLHDHAQQRLLKTLHLAVFERAPAGM